MLFAALIVPYFINWTSYRQDFEREASRILGQKVEVLGSAEARLLPFPSVTFNNVRVVNAETGEPMMTIAHFSMDAELAPFLRGQLLIFDMRIDRPTATMRLLPDGTLDWALRSRDELPTSSVTLESVEITNGAIDVVDEANGRTQMIRKLNATLSASSLAGPWNIQGTGALDGHSGAFSIATGTVDKNGGIQLHTRFLPDDEPVSIEADGRARFDGHKPRYDGQFTLQVLDLAAISGQPPSPVAKPDKHPAVARATGKFALDNEHLRVSEYRLEVGPTDDPYVVTGAATVDAGKAPNFRLTANGQQIDVDSLQNVGTRLGSRNGEAGKQGRKPPVLTPADRLAILHRIGSLIPIPPMPGKVSIKLPAVVAGDTTVRDVEIEAEPNGDNWKIDHFVGKFPGRTEVEAKGELMLGDRFGFAGHLLVAARQPSGLAEWLTGRVDPQIRLIDGAGFSADVMLTANEQNFEKLELAIGPSTIKGKFERSVPPQGRAQVTMDLRGDDINVDAVRALTALFTGNRKGISLADQDVTAELQADHFEVLGAEAQDVDAALSYRAGTLDVSRLKIGNLAGAAISIDGRLSGLAGTPKGEIHGSVSARDPKPLLTLLQVLGGNNVVLAHVAGSAAALGNAKLTATAKIGGDGLALNASGTAGGSAITIAFDRSRLTGALGSVPITLELTAQNDSVNKLLRQIGLKPLPIDAPGPGLLSMRIDGAPRNGAHVAMDLSGADTQLSANGTMAAPEEGPITGKLAVQLNSADLTPYLIMNGIGLPDSPDGMPVDLHTTVALDKDKIVLASLSGSASGNTLAGDLTLTRGDHPSLDGTLSLDEIDARWFARLILGPGAVRGPDGDWSKEEFAPAQNFGVDADIHLAARHAFLGYGAPASGLSSEVTLRTGTLDFSNVRAAWLGGKLEGSLRLSNSNGSGLLTTQISLKDADVAKAVASGASSPAATGSLTFSASVEGSGKSALALANALTGSGTASFHNLTIEGINTSGFHGILKAADVKDFKISADSARRLAGQAIGGGAFHPGEVSAPFTITSGKLNASNIAMADANAKVTGDVTIDLPREKLDASLAIAFKPGDNDYAGATPAVAVNFSGPVAAPKRTIDASELSNYLSLRAYEIQRRQVELLQAGVLEKQRLRRKIDLLNAEAEARARARAILFEEQRRRAAARAAYAMEQARAAAEQKAAADALNKNAAANGSATDNSPTPQAAGGSPDATGGSTSARRAPPAGLPDLKFPPFMQPHVN